MKKIVSLSAIILLGTTGCASLTGQHDHEHSDEIDDHMHEQMHSHMQEHMKEHMADGHMKDGGMMASKHEHEGEGMAGGHSHGEGGHEEGTLAGRPGDAENVSRTIHVNAGDDMRFQADSPLKFTAGETVKFVVTNTGAVKHEFVIGTKDEHKEHGEMMMKMPNMHHAPGGNALTLNPGETKELIWTFDNAWQIEAACNVPGHYQAGMHSAIQVED